MHMADALISPAVGGAMWVASGGLIAHCGRRVRRSPRANLVPMMGVLGAFVFAAQMINFSIPGTGSSGHLGGGLILAALLGPHAAFLAIASVLTVQAFFFADGGLLALGCNVFNLGFFPAFVAYPLVYRTLVRAPYTSLRAWGGTVAAAVVGLLPGALCVVLETVISGRSDLGFGPFVLLMLPIHLAIGVVEGLATAAVVAFVAQARPDALPTALPTAPRRSLGPVLAGLAAAAVVTGGVASWFASTHPDGLEWSIAKVTGRSDLGGAEAGVHKRLADLQERTAVLPDYGFQAAAADEDGQGAKAWPAVDAGTSVSGLVGGLLTLAVVVCAGWLLRARRAERGI